MVRIDTLEGIIDNVVDYHYDFFADVLYLRLLSDMQTPSLGQLADSGDIELHEENYGPPDRNHGRELVEAIRPRFAAGFVAGIGVTNRAMGSESSGLNMK